jgi:hypothetical protein
MISSAFVKQSRCQLSSESPPDPASGYGLVLPGRRGNWAVGADRRFYAHTSADPHNESGAHWPLWI